jgi:hypothetical protein
LVWRGVVSLFKDASGAGSTDVGAFTTPPVPVWPAGAALGSAKFSLFLVPRSLQPAVTAELSSTAAIQ